MAQQIKVTLVKSPIGHPEKHRRILKALGLTKLHKSRILYPTPTILGAVRKVVHFVKLEEVEEQ